MIFNGIKRRWLRKELKKLQVNQKRPSIKWPQSLVVIYDAQQPVNQERFYEWATELNIKKEHVTYIAYVQDKKKSSIENAHLVDKKLIKWSGGITDDDIKNLLKRSFDLQVNYFEQQNDLLGYISLALPSSFKVGYGDAPESSCDLSIAIPLKDYRGFIREVYKYLKILSQ